MKYVSNLINKLKALYQHNKTMFIIVVTFLLLFFTGFTYWSVEATSTPEFCILCHEIKPAHDSWVKSTHFNVPVNKKVAKCRDCHLPSWINPVNLLFAKAYHGTKDVYHHFADSNELHYKYYNYKMKLEAREDIPNANCLQCHQDIYNSKDASLKAFHQDQRKNKNLHCVDCHQNLVHTINK